MSSTHNSLSKEASVTFADLPDRQLDRLSCIHSLSGRKLSHWCEELNVLNTQVSGPMLITVFQELAAVRLTLDEVYDRYLILKPTLGRVHQAIEDLYTQKRLYLTSEARRAMDLAHAVDRAVILLLKSLLMDSTNLKQDDRARKQMAMIGGALYMHMAAIYRRLCEFSIPLPKGFWRECHGIYWFLVEHKAHAIEYKQSDFSAYPSNLRPDYIYKALIMSSIIDFSRYDRSLQCDLWYLMVELARGVNISQQRLLDGLFSVVLTEDLSHVPVRAIDEHDGLAVVHLNLTDAVNRLDHAMEYDNEHKITQNKALSRLFDEFTSLFTIERFRKQKRQNLELRTYGYFGLHQIHLFLRSTLNQGDHDQSADDIHYESAVSSKAAAQTLVVKDESDSGFRLESVAKHSVLIESGDLVYLKSRSLEALCTVRWMRLQPTGTYLIGVEKLAAELEPIEFAMMADGVLGEYEKAIRLIDNDLSGEKLTVLTRMALTKDDILTVRDNGRQILRVVVEAHWLVSGYVKMTLK